MLEKNIPCTQAKYMEFPELLFGTSESGIDYFDATEFVKAKGDIKKFNIATFRSAFFHWESAIVSEYDVKREELYVMSQTGNILIDESLALLFVSYIDPKFGIWMMERMSEMLQNGFVLSDTLIHKLSMQRLGAKEITESEVKV